MYIRQENDSYEILRNKDKCQEHKNAEEFPFRSNPTDSDSCDVLRVDTMRKSGSPSRNNRLFDDGAIVLRDVSRFVFTTLAERNDPPIGRVKGFRDRFERNVTISFSSCRKIGEGSRSPPRRCKDIYVGAAGTMNAINAV